MGVNRAQAADERGGEKRVQGDGQPAQPMPRSVALVFNSPYLVVSIHPGYLTSTVRRGGGTIEPT